MRKTIMRRRLLLLLISALFANAQNASVHTFTGGNAPPNPPTGQYSIYVGTDGSLHCITSTGANCLLNDGLVCESSPCGSAKEIPYQSSPGVAAFDPNFIWDQINHA